MRWPLPWCPRGIPAPVASRKPSGECVPVRGSGLGPSTRPTCADVKAANGSRIVPGDDEVGQVLLAITREDRVAYPYVAHGACTIGRVGQRFQSGTDFLAEVGVLCPRLDNALGFTAFEVDADAAL